MNYDSVGTLNVKTYLAQGALPAPGALVRIYGVDEFNREVEYSRITDVDGLSGPISLPAPNAAFSLNPGSPERPYALYDVKVMLEGFYDKTVSNVAVFSGVTTLLPVNMIPITGGYAPRDTLDTESEENPRLS